ncbi:MAG: hypothetical protein QOD06_2388 [Candidatus Binatota bacterium]|nr:hypothetical protein [Candidatus Binatota bacterium]
MRTAPAGAAETAESRLRAAIKTNDTWWPTLFSGPVANRLVRVLARRPGIHPNHVTVASMLLALAAAASFAVGTYPALFSGALLVQGAFVLDCADGQLARYRGLVSPFGEILDRIFDRAKPILYLSTLAWGADVHGHHEEIWILAFIAAFGFTLVEVYAQQFRVLAASAPPVHTDDATLPLPLRALDLPFLRHSGGDHYFLISLFCLLDRVKLVLVLLAATATIQLVVRPIYYAFVLRHIHGVWPWELGRTRSNAARRG